VLSLTVDWSFEYQKKPYLQIYIRHPCRTCLRGFFLVDAARAVLLIRLLLPSSDLTDMPGLSSTDVQDLQRLDDVSSHAADTSSETPALQNLEQLLYMLKWQLSERSRTANLWAAIHV